MFSHRFDQDISPSVAAHWFLLSFSAGSINAGGFLATGRFVTHVTGFATLFGVEAETSDLSTAVGLLSVPLFFMLGAFLAGLLIERPLFFGRKPHFDWVMGLSSLCLALAAGGASVFDFGGFGESSRFGQTYALMVLLCLASGLQNAAITSSSGRSVRVTHLTGLTTDLGLGLSRIVSFDLQDAQKKDELRANYLRIGSIVSFVLGSAVGAFFFVKLGYRGFFIPAAFAAYSALHGRRVKRN